MPATRVSMILVLAVLLGCGAPAKAPSDTQPGPDTQGPGPDTMAPDVPADGVGDSLADTADTGPRPAPRAWVIEDPADLLPGREAAGRPGDIRVENDHMVAIIGGLGHHKWGPFGGGILDLAPQGGEDRFQELFASAGFLRGLRPEAIEIVADGSTGDAVVRVTGTDGAIPLIDLVAGSQPVGLDVTLEYLLPADARCLEIRTVVSNPTDKTVTAALGDAVVWSETGNVFGPVAGYDAGGLLAQGEVEYVGADQPGLTFLLSPLGGAKVAVALLEDELSLLTYSMVPLAPGESVEVRRCLYATAGDGLDTLALHWEARGQALVDVSGTVQVPTAGYDLSLAKVEVYREDLFVGSVAPSPDGALAFRIPPGSYRGILRGEALEPVEVQWTATTGEAVTDLSFTPAAPARIDAQVTDAAGEPLPGRITVQAGPDAAVQAGHVAVVPSLDGASTLFLPAGTYTLTGSRGPQWSLCRGDVTVGAGQAVEFRCAITPELPLEGWIPGDLHVHSEFSIDSNMPRELRIAALVGEGLRFFAGT
ncbi:MAG: hypothetical protein FJ098_04865, partial [Deltaproteobacteria bacterium]|nr:hypothetical protein [Deltaproteobacteria bacterium]